MWARRGQRGLPGPSPEETRHLLGRQQQGLDGLPVLEQLCLLDDVDIVLQADGLVQGTPVCKVRALVRDPPRSGGRAVPSSAAAGHGPPSCLPLASLARGFEAGGLPAFGVPRNKPQATPLGARVAPCSVRNKPAPRRPRPSCEWFWGSAGHPAGVAVPPGAPSR